MTKYRIKEETIGKLTTYYPQWRNLLGFWWNYTYGYGGGTWKSHSLKEAQKVIDDSIERDNKQVTYIKYP